MNARVFRGLAVFAGLLVSFGTVAGGAEAESRPLFVEEQSQVKAGGSQRRTEVRGRRVKVDESAVAGVDSPDGADALELNLFTDKKLEVVKKHFKRRDKAHFTWFGKVSDDPQSTVVLVAGDGQMRGGPCSRTESTTRSGGRTQRPRRSSRSISVLSRRSCATRAPRRRGAARAGTPGGPGCGGRHRVGHRRAGGLHGRGKERRRGGDLHQENLAQLAVDWTNTSYDDGGITPRLNLVHAEQITYTESGDWNLDLDRLSGKYDLFMDNVHTLRETHRADVVVLLSDNSSYCGMAYLNAAAATAFALVAWDCAVENLSFAHEIGHLQGARHDRYVDPVNGPNYTYNHGDVDLVIRKRTVMAYNAQCDATSPGTFCDRLGYWSNPAVFYPGTSRPTGSAAYENNANVLNNTAYTVANFASGPTRLTVQSAYPATGVSIAAVSPADIDGTSSGTTPFTLSYDPDTPVTLTAPATNTAGFALLSWTAAPARAARAVRNAPSPWPATRPSRRTTTRFRR